MKMPAKQKKVSQATLLLEDICSKKDMHSMIAWPVSYYCISSQMRNITFRSWIQLI